MLKRRTENPHAVGRASTHARKIAHAILSGLLEPSSGASANPAEVSALPAGTLGRALSRIDDVRRTPYTISNLLVGERSMPDPVAHEFGRYIRRQRVVAQISLRAAARALSVSAVYLGEVERGVRPPLKVEHWDALIRVVPTIERSTLERLSSKARPIQLDLRDAPPRYQDLALALARRIEKQNISRGDLEKLFTILGEHDE